jgi:hypothetical protein
MCRSPTERRKEEEKVEDENSTSNNSENVSYSTNSCGIDFDALRQIGDPLADEVMRTIPPAFQQQKMASLILDNGRIQKRVELYPRDILSVSTQEAIKIKINRISQERNNPNK